MSERPVHIAAAILPLIEGAEFDRLVESIKDKGLDNPVVLTPAGEVLDGRNRLRACEAAGVAPRFVTHDGDPYDYVRRANLLRRQLTPSQLAAYEVELSEGAAREAAKIRQSEAGRNFGNHPVPEQVIAPGREPASGRTAGQEMAERVGVSTRTVERVMRVKAQDPEVFEKIKTGEVTAREAERNVARKAILSDAERQTRATATPESPPPAPIPLKGGLRRSPHQSADEIAERAVAQVASAVNAFAAVPWSSVGATRERLARELRGLRTRLSQTIDQLESEGAA